MAKNTQRIKESLGLSELLLKEITSLFEEKKISYMITGASSVIFYARPRTSHDLDFVIEVKEKDLKNVLKAFSSLDSSYLVDKDMIKDAVEFRRSFDAFHTTTGMKIDFWILKDDEFSKVSFERRIKHEVFGQAMFFTSPEDTILSKLVWFKKSGGIEKHFIDAAFVYQMQDLLDKKYLSKWAKKLDLGDLLKKLGKADLENYY